MRDHGDRDVWRWRPDRVNRRAQNLDAVVEIVRDTAERVAEAVGNEEVTLVLGGDCTVGIGTVAGHIASGDRIGLVYFDGHADLNIPSSVRPVAPLIASATLRGSLGAPFLIAGVLKSLYDAGLYFLFRDVKVEGERQKRPAPASG